MRIVTKVGFVISLDQFAQFGYRQTNAISGQIVRRGQPASTLVGDGVAVLEKDGQDVVPDEAGAVQTENFHGNEERRSRPTPFLPRLARLRHLSQPHLDRLGG